MRLVHVPVRTLGVRARSDREGEVDLLKQCFVRGGAEHVHP